MNGSSQGGVVTPGDETIPDVWSRERTVVLTGGAVLSMDPGVGDLVGDVVLRDGRVVAVGAGAGTQAPDDALTVDARGTIAVPGLVDGHVHAWEGVLRGLSPDSDFPAYMELTHGRFGPLMTPDDVAVGQRVTAWRALDSGVTTLVDNSHNVRSDEHAHAAVEALLSTGVRAVYAAGVGQGQPGDHLPDTLLRLRESYGHRPRLDLRLMEVSPTPAGWRFAAENGFGAVAETGGWVPDLDDLLGSEHLGPQVTLDHCAGLSDDQWRRVADSGAAVALAPRSDPHYGIGAHVPVLQANRHGVQEAISTDNEFEYGADLFGEMRLLLTVQRGLAFAAAWSGEPDPPRPYGVRDALRAATVGGARAAGLAGEIGVLAPGARADVVLISLERLAPVGSYPGAVVSYAAAADVDTVIVDGELRKWGGRLVGLDRGRLVAQAEASRDRLLGRLGLHPDDVRFASRIDVGRLDVR